MLIRAVILLLVAGGLMLNAGDWPGWMGPDAAGEWRGVRLPAEFGDKAVAELWSTEIGGGYAGIAVAGDQVFTLDRPADSELERVLCLDRKTGRVLWTHEYAADYGDLDHGNGPRSTPLVDGDRVYTLGTVGRLVCLNRRTGELVWEVDAVADLAAEIPTWGFSASPILAGRLLIVPLSARPGGTVVALDAATGEELWRALDDRTGYSTPVVKRIGGREQLVVWTADAAWGLTPEDGEILWTFPFRTSNFDVSIISPVVVGSRLYLSGYWDGAATAVLSDRGPQASWKERVPANLMATPLWRDGYLYSLDRRQGLLCLRWETGEVLWSDEHRMTPKDRNPHASMVWAGERAVFLNSEGELIVARLSPEGYAEDGRVAIIGPTWAPAAFAGQEVFARDDSRIVAVRVAPE
jgi:outer membrane protein assembly factor BamB